MAIAEQQQHYFSQCITVRSLAFQLLYLYFQNEAAAAAEEGEEEREGEEEVGGSRRRSNVRADESVLFLLLAHPFARKNQVARILKTLNRYRLAPVPAPSLSSPLRLFFRIRHTQESSQ